MNASTRLYEHIRDAEAFRAYAYQDQGGVWTIGFGRTKNVKKGDKCTREQAEAWLMGDVHNAEDVVNRAIHRPLSQCQFDACVMFAFNTGTMGNKFAAALNRGDFDAAVAAMAEFKYFTDKKTGKKKVSSGLVARRAEEIALFKEA